MQEVIFGKYLKDLRVAAHLTLRQVEIQAGVSDSYLSQVENGKRGIPSADILKKLAPVYGVPYEEMLVAAGYLPAGYSSVPPANAIPLDEDTIHLFPVYGKIAAGTPINAAQEAEETMSMDTRFFNMNGFTKDDFFFLRVAGHSMEPTIADTDLVLIRRQPRVENNQIAAVMCNGEDATVKRIVASGDKIILSSDNNSYPPMVYDAAACQIIGKVIKKIGDVR